MPTHATFDWRNQRVTLVPGDLIGRHATCALRIPDPRISEAHAMLAVRQGELVLLNLRGALLVRGERVTDPRLVVGVTLQLASDIALQVVDVQLPERIWFVQHANQLLPIDPVVSLLADRAIAGRHPHAVTTLWSDGESCFCEDARLVDGQGIQGHPATVHWRARSADLGNPTEQRRQGALTIRARFQTVTIDDAGAHALTLRGVPARIVHELVEIDGPVAWNALASEIWRDAPNEVTLRRRWDAALVRLRRHLATAGLRELVVSDGLGHVELAKRPGDTVHVDG